MVVGFSAGHDHNGIAVGLIRFAGARRLHMPEWERIISHKLEIIDGLYARLNDRIRTAQSQTLELAIVALIVELLLALSK